MKKLVKKDNVFLVLVIVLIGFIINMPLFTKNILTADVNLNNTYYNAYSWEISLGRFGLFVLGFIKSYLVISHVELLFSLILVGGICVLLCDLLEIKNKYLSLLVGFILVISPHVSTTLLFNYCSLGYTLAFFLSVFSIYILFLEKEFNLKYIISIICLVITLSIYQAYIQVSLTLFLLIILKKLFDRKLEIKELVKYIVVILSSLIIYFIIMKLSLLIFGITMSSYSGANEFGIDSILNIPKEVINTYITFYNYYFSDEILNNNYLFNNIFNLFLLLSFLGLLIYKGIKKKFLLKEFLLLAIIIILLPVCVNFILLIIPSTKIQLLMASSYILIFVFIIYLIKDLKWSKYGVILLLGLLSRNFIIENFATIKTLEITYNKTYKIASNILDNINRVDYKSKVMITGNLDESEYYNYNGFKEFDNLKRLNFGFVTNKSLFWEEYTNIKNGWSRFFYEYLGYSLNFVSESEYNQIINSYEFKEMDIYPKKNSIKKINDTIVIKLS